MFPDSVTSSVLSVVTFTYLQGPEAGLVLGVYPMKDLNPEIVQKFVSSSAISAKITRNICNTLQSMWTTAKA